MNTTILTKDDIFGTDEENENFMNTYFADNKDAKEEITMNTTITTKNNVLTKGEAQLRHRIVAATGCTYGMATAAIKKAGYARALATVQTWQKVAAAKSNNNLNYIWNMAIADANKADQMIDMWDKYADIAADTADNTAAEIAAYDAVLAATAKYARRVSYKPATSTASVTVSAAAAYIYDKAFDYNTVIRYFEAIANIDMAKARRVWASTHHIEYTQSNLTTASENVTAAESAIRKTGIKGNYRRHFTTIKMNGIATAPTSGKKHGSAANRRSVLCMNIGASDYVAVVPAGYYEALAEVRKAEASTVSYVEVKVTETDKHGNKVQKSVLMLDKKHGNRLGKLRVKFAELMAKITVAKAEDAKGSIGAAMSINVDKLTKELINNMPEADYAEGIINMPGALNNSETVVSANVNVCVNREEVNNGEMFKFNLQMFAEGGNNMKNKNNKKYIEAIKSHDGNGLCYRFTAIGTNDGVRFVLDTTSAEITPLTRHFLQTNGAFQNLCCREMIAKRGFNGYVILDLSNIATSSNPKLQAASTFYFAADYYLGKDENGKTVIAVRIPKNDKFYVVSESRVHGAFRELKRSDIYENNVLKDGWTRFKSNKLASASKGRKIMADMFAEDSKFIDILNEATFGEFKAVEGMMLTNKGQADKWTRIGSKSTRMGSMHIAVENFIIRLTEDGATDGSYEIAARKMAEAVADELGIEVTAKLEMECLGYILQARPYTGKGAGETKSDKNIAEHAKLEKIYVIRKENMTDRDKQILAMFTDKELRKAAGIKLGDDSTYPVELKGYTAIGVIGNDNYGWDLIGDLNFYKDQWDFTRTSGMNVLAVAHYEQEEGFKNAFTSGQMMKVVLRAVNEANDKDLAKKFDIVMKSIIDDNIADKLDFNKSVQNFRADRKFDLSFPGRDYMTINPTTWRNSISTHQMVITQMINSVGDMINRDRYAIPGHSAMITCDSSYDFNGISVLSVNAKVVEVYDPVANRYFDEQGIEEAKRYGIAIKYPAMGTREFLILFYVSEYEMIRRIKALAITDEQKAVLIEEVKNFKEGGMMIPSNLEVIAWFAAGSDEDGDKVTALFVSKDGNDLASIVIESGMLPRAVKIGTPKDTDNSKTALTVDAYQVHASKQIAVGNKSVGVVTNVFRMFTEGIYQDLNNPEVFNFYASVFKKLGMGSEAKSHNEKYSSLVELETVDGNVVVNKTTEKITYEIFEALNSVPVNMTNIKAVLDDFDVLGRHCQELTIDAQKKFYDVFCDWMDDIATSFTILPLKFGITMSFVCRQKRDGAPIGVYFVENDGYKVSNSNRVSVANTVVMAKKCLVLTDVFSAYRVYSANKCMALIEAEVEEYKLTVATEKSRMMQRAAELEAINISNDIKAIRRMERVSNAYYTISNSYSAQIKALREEMKAESAILSWKQQEKLNKEMKKSVDDEFATMINYLSNEIRCIAAEEGITGDEMVRIFDKTSMASDVKSRVIKQERFVYDIHNSESRIWEMKLRDSAMTRFLADSKMTELIVWNGSAMLFAAGFGADQPVDFVDGVYDIRVNVLANGEKEVFISRPMDEFVDIPATNNNVRLVNGYVSTQEDADRMDQLLVSGSEYMVKYDSRNKKYSLVDAAGNVIAPMTFGGNNKEDMVGGEYAYKVYGKRYANFSGKLVAKIVNTTAKEHNNKKLFNYIIVLEK